MRYRFPPLNSLKIFEAVLRRGSIRQAAEELCLTPQAVSQQLKQLEAFVGQALFVRGVRNITPTKAATALGERVRHAFDEIAEGLSATRHAQGEKSLRLYVSPYFATTYLVPNLRAFTERYAGMKLNMGVGVEMIDLDANTDVDAIIHWTYGAGKDLIETPLIEDRKVLAVSTELASRMPVRTPQDVLTHMLVVPTVANHLWEDTFRLLGLADHALPPVMAFSSHAAMLEATLAGLGVGLVSHKDALKEIASGRLIAPFGVDLLAGLSYEQTPRFSLFHRKESANLDVITDFKDWLLDAVCRDDVIGYPSRCTTG
ncbi:LysR substrate-binding domain-containing protein [Alcaligenaceae bacterium C4P045]|nr:LysR substrate-binding domain-containing protein [Alcaligenaceae bacterium B3P038]MDQ2151391.1 LysR substrate-binding domain-containing protein [Alcaligenaceae bacterium C4P045]